MKSKKSVAVVTAIVMFLLAATLGGLSPISYAQVEQEIDEAAEQEETNATDTEQEVVEASEQEDTKDTDEVIDKAKEQDK